MSAANISITSPPGLVSIVVPCCGMLDYTRLCVPSVLRSSREPIELIFLDIGSLDVPGWLDAMIALAGHAPDHGMVGPMSNHAALEQLVETVPYRMGPQKGARPGDPLVDVQAVQAFAREFRAAHQGKWAKVPRLGGFCLLIRRQVLDRLRPGLAEWTDLSLFDTDILGAKAQQEGFALVRVQRPVHPSFRNAHLCPRRPGARTRGAMNVRAG